MNNITVRMATVADIAIITANNSAMAEETESRRLDPETLRSGVSRLLSDSTRGVYYLAERDGNVVGQVLITREWSDWRDGWFWWIQSVYVTPAARRAGVYRTLYEHVRCEAGRASDVRGLRLYVDKSNGRAQRTYERLGMNHARYSMYEVDV